MQERSVEIGMTGVCRNGRFQHICLGNRHRHRSGMCEHEDDRNLLARADSRQLRTSGTVPSKDSWQSL